MAILSDRKLPGSELIDFLLSMRNRKSQTV